MGAGCKQQKNELLVTLKKIQIRKSEHSFSLERENENILPLLPFFIFSSHSRISVLYTSFNPLAFSFFSLSLSPLVYHLFCSYFIPPRAGSLRQSEQDPYLSIIQIVNKVYIHHFHSISTLKNIAT